MKSAVTPLKIRNSAGVDNAPAELIQTGVEYEPYLVSATRVRIMDRDTVHYPPQQRPPETVLRLPHNQPSMPAKQSHVEDLAEQIEPTCIEYHCGGTGSLHDRAHILNIYAKGSFNTNMTSIACSWISGRRLTCSM